MEKEELRVLILSAGKIDNELAKIFGEIPSGLIPLNGKPVIFRIIDKLIDEGFKKISITIGYKKEILEQIVKEQYKNQCDLIQNINHLLPNKNYINFQHWSSPRALILFQILNSL